MTHSDLVAVSSAVTHSTEPASATLPAVPHVDPLETAIDPELAQATLLTAESTAAEAMTASDYRSADQLFKAEDGSILPHPRNIETMKREERLVPLKHIKVDRALRCRKDVENCVVDEYAEMFTLGHWLGRLVGFQEAPDKIWLADGFYRYDAAKNAEVSELPFILLPGGRQQAASYAAAANKRQGTARRTADVRIAIRNLLKDNVWKGRSNCWIAEWIGTNDKLVARVRSQTQPDMSDQRREQRSRHGKGKTNLRTAHNKKRSPERPKFPEPDVTRWSPDDRADYAVQGILSVARCLTDAAALSAWLEKHRPSKLNKQALEKLREGLKVLEQYLRSCAS